MLSSILVGTAVVALLVVFRQTRSAFGHGGRALLAVYCCSLVYITTSAISASTATNSNITMALAQFSFVLLFPLLLLNIKHYANVALPQWRSLRAFIVGVPLVIGLSTSIDVLQGLAELETDQLSSHRVAYGFAAICFVLATWRFTSTPRHRKTLALLALAPVIIAAFDLSWRLGYLTVFPTSPGAAATLLATLVMTFMLAQQRTFSVRPIARSALVDHVQDILLALDPKFRIADCNRAAADLFGITEPNLISTDATTLLPAELSTALHQHWISDNNRSHVAELEPTRMLVPWPISGNERFFEAQLSVLRLQGAYSGHLLLLRDITRRHKAECELAEANEKLSHLANTDALTQLYNRRYLMQQLETEIERHSRSGLTLGVLLLDLDHFKQVNDNFGHPAGDRVLVAVANCMQETARESDVIARFGGEEFAIVAVDTMAQGPSAFAERLRANIAALKFTDDAGKPFCVTASIGCVQTADAAIDAATLLTMADQALYSSKRTGRNKVTSQAFNGLSRAKQRIAAGSVTR